MHDEGETGDRSDLPAEITAEVASGVIGMLLTPALGPLGQLVGSAMTPVLALISDWDRRAWHRAQEVLFEGAEIGGLSPAELPSWMQADDRRFRLVVDAVAAAMAARDRSVLTALSRVLADGCGDDARLDMDSLYVSAIRELSPADVVTLRRIVDEPNPMDNFNGVMIYDKGNGPTFTAPTPGTSTEFSVAHCQLLLPNLSEGMDYIFATLVRLGCLKEGTVRQLSDDGDRFFTATPFGTKIIEWLTA